ncbi:MAG: elongation factor G [Bdellovibrionales bacterium]|nr:elongation factor G [Bdellovibrionales bacterium]
MKTYSTEDIRNVVLVGHGACGKTMLSESMLAAAKVINRIGSIENGSTVSDYHPDEQKRKLSIHATPMFLEWNDRKINIIDTPGYADFVGEAISATVVSDLAVVTVSASSGVEVGTESAWDLATRAGIPKVIVVTAIDKDRVDFEDVVDGLREQFGNKVIPFHFPVNPGPGCRQIVDVLRKKLLTFAEDHSGEFEESEIPADSKARASELFAEIVECIAESDETLLEKFFEHDTLTPEEVRAALHKVFLERGVIPLFCASGVANVGVTRVLDFISKFGPSPAERPMLPVYDADDTDQLVQLTPSDAKPVALAFKTLIAEHIGEMSFLKVLSGGLATGMDPLLNPTRRKSEKLGQLYVMNGKERTSVAKLCPGDIGTVVKLKDTHTGNTLCSNDQPVLIAPISYPEPNVHSAISVATKGDEDKIGLGLSTLHEEDPTFVYLFDKETKETVVSGQGELHLQTTVEQLKARWNVDVELTAPRIPYRETIHSKGEAKYRHKKQTGGAGQFAEVWMRVEPRKRGEGVEFTNSLVGQNVDRVFVPSVEKGVNAACEEGILAGYTVVDVKIDFYDGKMHPVDSKDVAFQIAGKGAFKEAFLNANPCLLEPIWNVEIRVPEQYMGDVMGDISSRRGKVLGMDTDGRFQVVKASVPQGSLYRYATTLRSMTGGRGVFTRRLSHYEEMPPDIEKKIIAEAHEKKDEKAA